MQSHDSQRITERFFTALYYLKTNRVIRGKNTFARRYGIGHGNLLQLERNKVGQGRCPVPLLLKREIIRIIVVILHLDVDST